MGSSIFYMLLALWVGSEGLIRSLNNAKPGGFVVMLMGYGAFFVLQYYAFAEGLFANFQSSVKKRMVAKLLVISLGLNIVGLIVFVIAFFRVQGIWTLLSGL